MRIAIAADHAGFALKERLREALAGMGHQVMDLGATGTQSADYPDFAAAVARRVAGGECERGILICSTGVGMSIAANKVDGIRAALAVNPEQVRLTRAHNDANVLALGARYTDEATAASLADIFLRTGFEGGRHARRVGKITEMEREAAARLPAGSVTP